MGTGGMGDHIPKHELRTPVQDMPPTGGYPELPWKSQNKSRGPSGLAIWGGMTLAMLFGFYRIGEGNLERNAAKREKREARMAMVPYLQAEDDVRYHASYLASLEEEARIMKGVKGWKVGESVYHNKDIWMPPTPVGHPRDQGF